MPAVKCQSHSHHDWVRHSVVTMCRVVNDANNQNLNHESITLCHWNYGIITTKVTILITSKVTAFEGVATILSLTSPQIVPTLLSICVSSLYTCRYWYFGATGFLTIHWCCCQFSVCDNLIIRYRKGSVSARQHKVQLSIYLTKLFTHQFTFTFMPVKGIWVHRMSHCSLNTMLPQLARNPGECAYEKLLVILPR